MKWIPFFGLFLAKFPIPGKQWNLWFWYQWTIIALSALALLAWTVWPVFV